MRTRGDGDSLGAKAPGRIPLLASPAKHGSPALHIVYTLRQGSLGLQGETVRSLGGGAPRPGCDLILWGPFCAETEIGLRFLLESR